jgi:endonuclease/exonuclease/phosphatase family metal-dependent hydrolase
VTILLGLLAFAWDAGSLIGWAAGRSGASEGGQALTVLHWNVQWGGGRPLSLGRWESLVAAIAAESPDVVLLSESPPDAWVKVLLDQLGPEWTSVGIENPPGASDWWKLVILSNRPIRDAREVALTDGHAVEATIDGGRFLLVDRPSNPLRWRVPFLRSIADQLEHSTHQRHPYDLVAGDFNCPARSSAFGRVLDAGVGYRLASRQRFGWRTTWPSALPIYDIDHVLIARGLGVSGVRMLAPPVGDHRGQVVCLQRLE